MKKSAGLFGCCSCPSGRVVWRMVGLLRGVSPMYFQFWSRDRASTWPWSRDRSVNWHPALEIVDDLRTLTIWLPGGLRHYGDRKSPRVCSGMTSDRWTCRCALVFIDGPQAPDSDEPCIVRSSGVTLRREKWLWLPMTANSSTIWCLSKCVVLPFGDGCPPGSTSSLGPPSPRHRACVQV